jgi:hypothetical protein
MSGKELIYTSIYVGVIPTSGWMICIWSQWFSQPVRKRYHKNVRNWFLKRKKVSVDIKSNASGGDAPSEVLGGFFLGQREHAHSWRYLLDILVFCPDFSDSDTKIKPPVGRDWHFQCLSWKFWNILEHRLGVIDIFSVCRGNFGIFWNIWLFRVSDLFQIIRIQLPL